MMIDSDKRMIVSGLFGCVVCAAYIWWTLTLSPIAYGLALVAFAGSAIAFFRQVRAERKAGDAQ